MKITLAGLASCSNSRVAWEGRQLCLRGARLESEGQHFWVLGVVSLHTWSQMQQKPYDPRNQEPLVQIPYIIYQLLYIHDIYLWLYMIIYNMYSILYETYKIK